jgi:hypothetical protein
MKLSFGIAVGALIGGCFAMACAGNAGIAVKYAEEQKLCIDKAATRAEADICRCKVAVAYNHACVDVITVTERADAGGPK